MASKIFSFFYQLYIFFSKGLTSAKVDELRLIHGFNTMKPVKGEHPVVVCLRKLVELFHILLIIGTFCFVLYAIFPNDEAATDNVEILTHEKNKNKTYF